MVAIIDSPSANFSDCLAIIVADNASFVGFNQTDFIDVTAGENFSAFRIRHDHLYPGLVDIQGAAGKIVIQAMVTDHDFDVGGFAEIVVIRGLPDIAQGFIQSGKRIKFPVKITSYNI